MEKHGVRVQIDFKAHREGGRATATDLCSGIYRPHLRVGQGEYLGVAMFNGPRDFVMPGASACADAVLMFQPNVDYSPLICGVVFEVLEGAQVVGTGKVISE